MGVIRIVTDSSASLPRDLVEEHGITVVPLTIQIGDRSHLDGVDLEAKEFYRCLEGGPWPTTSQPSPGTFIDIYGRLLERAETIISIHVTGRASGTCQCARLATAMFPDRDIEVVDSQYTSMGLGFMALEAARAARLGLSKGEILALIGNVRSRLNLFGIIPGLSYLQRSGRVSLGKALLGSLLHIRPIITFRDGLVEVCDRVRSSSAAITRLFELMESAVGTARVRMAVVHTNALEQAEELAAEVRRRFNCEDVIITDAGPALAVHGGPGILGLVSLRL